MITEHFWIKFHQIQQGDIVNIKLHYITNYIALDHVNCVVSCKLQY